MNKPTTWHTRCPECWVRIDLTDWDDGDVVLAYHLHRTHAVPYPAWMDRAK